jgi:hypothetical protein
MEAKENLLGHCGLYCGDCAGYSGEIAAASVELKKAIDKYHFNLTAKELYNEELEEFENFYEMLQFMTKLKCPQVCRERDATKESCEIKKCCLENGFFACYECGEFKECDKLKSLEDLHGDSCIKNLEAIKEMGLSKWVQKGKRLWFGSENELSDN